MARPHEPKKSTGAKRPSRAKQASPETSGPKLDTRFKPGAEWRGNANGRPKGSRNKLNAKFLDDLHALWMEQGEDILQRTAKNRPQDIVKAQVALLPKETLELLLPPPHPPFRERPP